jgi:hypothetical protein
MAKVKRRSNRDGSIWQRQDRRWTGAAYVLTSAGTFRRVYVYGRTRDEVHAKLVQLQDTSRLAEYRMPTMYGRWGSTSITG